jgi:16S rRNA (guanine966-N2)-methyltransferase
VLDLFAGSGALGLESLSRGAVSAMMVDDNREAYLVIKKNLTSLGLDAGRVMQSDAMRFLNRDRGSYDLIFADPPYFKQSSDRDFVAELLSHPFLPDRLAEDGLLIIEDPPDNLRGHVEGWELLDQRRYGGCRILFYQRAKTT